MKILLDTNMSFRVRDDLIAAGYDVIWTGDWVVDPGDEEILATAHLENRILITQDKDFGELAIVKGQPHAGIVRLSNLATTQHSNACLEFLNRFESELLTGAIVTIDSRRVRIRPADTD
jgi:predicted nuclease of predicted toxin-antitoxin system